MDDNAFQVELATIVENSFNIHQEGTKAAVPRGRNPRAKLMAYARNDKLFADGADQAQLAKQVRYVIGGSDEVAKTFRVIALPEVLVNDPWTALTKPSSPTNGMTVCPSSCCPRKPTSSTPRWAAGSKTSCRSAATPCASCCRARAVPTPSWIATCSSSPAPK